MLMLHALTLPPGAPNLPTLYLSTRLGWLCNIIFSFILIFLTLHFSLCYTSFSILHCNPAPMLCDVKAHWLIRWFAIASPFRLLHCSALGVCVLYFRVSHHLALPQNRDFSSLTELEEQGCNFVASLVIYAGLTVVKHILLCGLERL